MTQEQLEHFFRRIDQLTINHNPLFGKMNVNQMVCHCTDQLRLPIGTISASEDYVKIAPEKIMTLAKAKKQVPAPKGLGQVEGGGTTPTTLENDKQQLKEHILSFLQLPNDFDFAPHPYFGKIDKNGWMKVTIYHLNHHLGQFNV